MKVLLINGSPNQTGCTYTALHEIETTLQTNGIETELLYLGKKPIAGCIACGACMKTGHCFRDDLVQEIQNGWTSSMASSLVRQSIIVLPRGSLSRS